nr:hypothetical protein [Tanacetum cinerariifolium]
MALTFADTHNMIAYLTKSDVSEGFNQIMDFLNVSSIKYALTVNPNIYVLCIIQFWTSVFLKMMKDVPILQALVDKKKVVITEATIRDALRLNDAEGIDCLPNEEIFTELARIGYEKPFTKITFYKAFFSSQWKFLIHIILQCMSAKRTSWNEFSSSMASAVIFLSTSRKFNFSKYILDSLVRNVDSSTKFYMYPRFLQLMIRAQVGNLSSHTTKYSSPALTQKVFANMRSVGKGFSGVETPLFEGMIVAQQVDEGAAEVNVYDVLVVGVADEGAASVADDDVSATIDEPSIPSPTPPTQTPPPSQDIPSTSQRVKKLERRNKLKVSKLRRLKKVGTTQRVETSDDTVMDDVSKQERIIASIDADVDVTLKDIADIAKEVTLDAEIEESAYVQGRQAESQVQNYQIDLEHADKVLSMQDDEVEPAELQEVVEVVTTTKLITEVVTAASAIIVAAAPTLTTASSAARKRNGVVIRDLEKTTTPSTIIHTKLKSKDKGKGIMVHEPKPLKKKTQLEQDEAYARELEAELNKNIDWDEGMTYDDIRPIFEKKFNSNVAFLEKTREQMKEEDSRVLKRISESQVDKEAKKQKLDEEVEELRKHIQIVPNDDDDVYTKATFLALKAPVADYEIYT